MILYLFIINLNKYKQIEIANFVRIFLSKNDGQAGRRKDNQNTVTASVNRPGDNEDDRIKTSPEHNSMLRAPHYPIYNGVYFIVWLCRL